MAKKIRYPAADDLFTVSLKKRDTGTQRRIPPRRQCLATVLSILPEKPKNQLVNLQKNLFFRGLFFCYLSLALKKPVGYNNL